MLPTIATGNVGSALAGEYEVANSLRFDDGSSENLTRSLGSSESSLKTGTFSFWVKRGKLSEAVVFYSNEVENDNNRGYIQFDSSDRLRMVDGDTSATHIVKESSQKHRDPSAWYHIVIRLDTTQSTASDRARFYVNGNQITAFDTDTNPPQNEDLKIFEGGQTNKNHIGRIHGGSGTFYDGYLAEFVYCDGQSLDPTSFGEFDSDTNIWKPIDVSGLTFGNNGFYLDFENSGSLGADVSGNGNNFTVNNLTSIDQSTDTCTNNFATMNPLGNYYAGHTFSQGNLKLTSGGSSSVYSYNNGTIGVSQGKWYWEMKCIQETYMLTGIHSKFSNATSDELGNDAYGWGYWSYYSGGAGGGLRHNNSDTSYGDAYVSGDIIGVALDLDNNALYFSRNGVWQNSGVPTSGASKTGAISITDPSSTPDGVYYPAWGSYDTPVEIAEFNFGSPPYSISSGNSDGNGYGNFEYSVPSGYYALNSKNLAEYG